MDATTVAVDLAKDVFEVAVANRASRIVDRRRLTRRQFETFLDGLTAGTTVVMEACGTAHYWGRRGQARGLQDEPRAPADGSEPGASACPRTAAPRRFCARTDPRHLRRAERTREDRGPRGHHRDECRTAGVCAGNHEPREPEKKAATSGCHEDSQEHGDLVRRWFETV